MEEQTQSLRKRRLYCHMTGPWHAYQDQEDTHIDVLTGNGEVNATNPNADIKDTMTPSLIAR